MPEATTSPELASTPAVSETTPATTTPAATTPAATTPATIASGTETDGAETVAKVETIAPADWPDDWRSKIAGEDKKALKALERYNAPAEVFKALQSAQHKISSVGLKTPKPENATPEQLAEWRKEQGIPEAPDKYEIKLDDGIVPGEADKPVLDSFTKHAHSLDLPPDKVSGVLNWYYREQDRAIAARKEQDIGYHDQNIADLSRELGGDFNRTVNSVSNGVGKYFGEFGDELRSARTADGRLLGDNPTFIKAMAKVMREIDPVATLVPSAGGSGKSIQDELAEIRKFASDNPDKYDNDKAMQARRAEITEAMLKAQKRNAA